MTHNTGIETIIIKNSLQHVIFNSDCEVAANSDVADDAVVVANEADADNVTYYEV